MMKGSRTWLQRDSNNRPEANRQRSQIPTRTASNRGGSTQVSRRTGEKNGDKNCRRPQAVCGLTANEAEASADHDRTATLRVSAMANIRPAEEPEHRTGLRLPKTSHYVNCAVAVVDEIVKVQPLASKCGRTTVALAPYQTGYRPIPAGSECRVVQDESAAAGSIACGQSSAHPEDTRTQTVLRE